MKEKQVKIKNVRDLNILKNNLTLATLKKRIVFDEKILSKGLVMLLNKELEETDKIATTKDIDTFALNL